MCYIFDTSGCGNMYKAYIFRMYPDEKQIELINKSFGVSRFIYNQFLEENKLSIKKQAKVNLHLKSVRKYLI